MTMTAEEIDVLLRIATTRAPAAAVADMQAALRFLSNAVADLTRERDAAGAALSSLRATISDLTHEQDAAGAALGGSYDRGRRDMLNALLALNPYVAGRLALLKEEKPDPEGRLPFDVVFWVTEVAARLGIEPVEPHEGAVSRPAHAVDDVLAERRRQVIEEGWTAEHDDEHDRAEMAAAALCYVQAACCTLGLPRTRVPKLPGFWPWDDRWWKPASPDDPRRDLVKAGALILAEIERLDRAALAGGLDG